jgi:hypothetical protein
MSPEPGEARLRQSHEDEGGSAIFRRIEELRGELIPILEERRRLVMRCEVYSRQFELERLVSYVEEMKETLACLEEDLAAGGPLYSHERETVIALAKAEAAVERGNRARDALEQLQATLAHYIQSGEAPPEMAKEGRDPEVNSFAG